MDNALTPRPDVVSVAFGGIGDSLISEFRFKLRGDSTDMGQDETLRSSHQLSDLDHGTQSLLVPISPLLPSFEKAVAVVPIKLLRSICLSSVCVCVCVSLHLFKRFEITATGEETGR